MQVGSFVTQNGAMQTWSPAVPSARCLGTARAGTPGQPVLRSSRFTATACKSAAVDSPQKPSGPPVSTAEQSIDQFYDNEAFTSLDLTDRPPIDTGIMLQGAPMFSSTLWHLQTARAVFGPVHHSAAALR